MPVAPARFKPRRPGGKQHGVTYDQRRPSAAKRLYGRAWQKARLHYLRTHTLCVECEREGLIRAATVVDHRIPHQGDKRLFWDRSNWQPLCTSHHSRKTAREDGGFGNPKG